MVSGLGRGVGRWLECASCLGNQLCLLGTSDPLYCFFVLGFFFVVVFCFVFVFPLGRRCKLSESRSFTPWCAQNVQGDSRHGVVEIPVCTGHFKTIGTCLLWLRGSCDLININAGVDLISFSPHTLLLGGNLINQGG